MNEKMTPDRAAEILDPEHREHYDSIETVNEACRMGMEALKNPLLEFIRQEVPFRFREILGVPEDAITEELTDECVKTLWDGCDRMLNYDWIDEAIGGVLKEYGIECDEKQ